MCRITESDWSDTPALGNRHLLFLHSQTNVSSERRSGPFHAPSAAAGQGAPV